MNRTIRVAMIGVIDCRKGLSSHWVKAFIFYGNTNTATVHLRMASLEKGGGSLDAISVYIGCIYLY